MRPLSSIMMLILVLACAMASFAGGDKEGDECRESIEPPLKYSLAIDGKSHEIIENQPIEIEGEFEDPVVKLTVDNYRVFPYGGISFKYPRYFTFEADLVEPGCRIWTLSGNDCKILCFEYSAPVTAKAFARRMVANFGEDNCKLSEDQSELGDKTMSRVTIRAKVVDSNIVCHVYDIPSSQGAKLLVIQDFPDDDSGGISKEGKKTIELLKKTFKPSQ